MEFDKKMNWVPKFCYTSVLLYFHQFHGILFQTWSLIFTDHFLPSTCENKKFESLA